jgi:hypothetical protein
VFLVAVSPDESGEDALDWLMSELVEDGDEVIAMRVKDMGESERHTEVAHEHLREEANEMLQTVLQKNNEEDGRKVSIPCELGGAKRRTAVPASLQRGSLALSCRTMTLSADARSRSLSKSSSGTSPR